MNGLRELRGFVEEDLAEKLVCGGAYALQLHLQRFTALQHVNVSGNPFLGTAGVTEIVSSLAGA